MKTVSKVCGLSRETWNFFPEKYIAEYFKLHVSIKFTSFVLEWQQTLCNLDTVLMETVFKNVTVNKATAPDYIINTCLVPHLPEVCRL